MRNVDTAKINRNKRTVRASLTVLWFFVKCWGGLIFQPTFYFLFIIFFLKFFYLLCYYNICINCYGHYNIYKEKDKEQLCILVNIATYTVAIKLKISIKSSITAKILFILFLPILFYSSICKVSSSQSAISLSSLSSRASFCF